MKPSYLIRIVDDEPEVCRSLRFMLEVAGFSVQTYLGAESFLNVEETDAVGCLLTDVRMPGMSGLELQHKLKERHSNLPIVFLSAHGDIRMAVEAVQAGAVDFLVKPPEAEALIRVLEKACQMHAERRAVTRDLKRMEEAWAQLTDAERSTAELASKGLPNRQIASVLDVTEDTIRSRRAVIFDKLDVCNAVELSDYLHELESLRKTVTW